VKVTKTESGVMTMTRNPARLRLAFKDENSHHAQSAQFARRAESGGPSPHDQDVAINLIVPGHESSPVRAAGERPLSSLSSATTSAPQ